MKASREEALKALEAINSTHWREEGWFGIGPGQKKKVVKFLIACLVVLPSESELQGRDERIPDYPCR